MLALLDEIFHPPPSSENTPVSKPTFKSCPPAVTLMLSFSSERVFFFYKSTDSLKVWQNIRNLTFGMICQRCAKHRKPLSLCRFFFNPCSRLFSKPVAATSKRLETPSGFEFWVAKLFSLKFIGNGIETKETDSCSIFRQDSFSVSPWHIF